ncbi:MAG: LptF/LptG family permease [Helicobacteraceae bacterium]|jgi:lipopolysaccharide export system permease protein|nr:LptF/LptG family permease [Helicobacteraceae bacterium]
MIWKRKSLLDSYLLSQLWTGFFPLFGALFLIATMVSFVQLSAMTAVVKISFSEMFFLYLAQTPQIFLYVLPITFFADLATTLSRLSGDLETIVFFSLKASVWRVMRPFVPLAVALAIGLFVLGMIVAPKAQYLQKAFLYEKQDDAQINIRASEFGQKFGDWLLFVGAQEGVDSYKEVALYSRANSNGAGIFVLADSAKVSNNRGILRLNLQNGRGYETSEEGVRQMDYELMRVNETGKARALEYGGIIEHWQKAKTSRGTAKDLTWALLAVIFTLISLPAATIGIYSPRFAKNRSGAWVLFFSLLFYAPAITIGDRHGVIAFIVPIVWLLITFLIVRPRLKHF